jgi:hypothetical protein
MANAKKEYSDKTGILLGEVGLWSYDRKINQEDFSKFRDAILDNADTFDYASVEKVYTELKMKVNK